MSQPIKNREAFFDYLEEGLQAYFDNHDRLFGGIIHLTVGVREGQVGGIIKSERMLSYSGFTLDRVRDIIAYVLPKHVPRTEVQLITDAIIEELRMERPPLTPPKEGDSESTEAEPQPKKPRTRGRKKKTEVEPQNTKNHEQGEEDPQACPRV